MSDPTPPAVSEAMREAVAQGLCCFFHGLADWSLLPEKVRGEWFAHADRFIAGPIASEIARLTGERDESDGTLRYCEKLWSQERGVMLDRIQAAEAALSRLQAGRDAEVGKLRSAINALQTIANGEVLVFDEGEEREVTAWMSAEEMQQIANDTLDALIYATPEKERASA